MARKGYAKNKRTTKLQAVPLSLYYKTPIFTGTRAVTLDLPQHISLLNRRFYRQGIQMAVGSVEVYTSPANVGSATLLSLPKTWVMSNSWEKAFRHWQEMNKAALEGTESVRPRFLDFKIYMDSLHHGSEPGATNLNLLPQSFEAVSTVEAIPGEWEYSKVAIPNTASPGTSNERELIATGGSYPGVGTSGLDAVSLIEGYAASRGLPAIADPNVPGDAADVAGSSAPQNWIGALTNEGTRQDEQVLDNMISENNVAPYPFENGPNPLTPGVGYPDTMYPGGENNLTGLEIVDIGYISPTTVGGVTRLKGGVFPCGLLRLLLTTSESNFVAIKVNLVPGTHRGYLCESMQDM